MWEFTRTLGRGLIFSSPTHRHYFFFSYLKIPYLFLLPSLLTQIPNYIDLLPCLTPPTQKLQSRKTRTMPAAGLSLLAWYRILKDLRGAHHFLLIPHITSLFSLSGNTNIFSLFPASFSLLLFSPTVLSYHFLSFSVHDPITIPFSHFLLLQGCLCRRLSGF